MSYLREKVEEYLKDRVVLISEHDTRYLGCPADHVTAILALFEEEWKALANGDASMTSNEWRSFLNTHGESEWDGGLLQEKLIDDMEIGEARLGEVKARVKELEDDKSHLLGTITRMVGTEREDEAKHEAREEKLREALVKVRRIVETDSQIHSQIKVSNIVSAALGKEEPK